MTRIRREVIYLRQFHPSIASCAVTVDCVHGSDQQKPHYGVKVELQVPETMIVIEHASHTDLDVALQSAMEEARHRLLRMYRP